MFFKEVLGQEKIVSHLKENADANRIPHAQLFVGKLGFGLLSIALEYANYILCEGNEENLKNNIKIEQVTHPDLHFVYPVTTTDSVKKHPVSKLFLTEWRNFIKENAYGGLFDWMKFIGVENKQGQIGTDEALDISKALSLKPFEAKYKVMIIWMADKMNTSCSNKLLKLIEEPPANTIFLLISEDLTNILPTISSRCQVLNVPPIERNTIKLKLEEDYNLNSTEAEKIALGSRGDFNEALNSINIDENIIQFEKWFITWVRSAFKAKGNKTVIVSLMEWSNEIAKHGRETQKQFLNYCSEFFRQAFLFNYSQQNLLSLRIQSDFKIEKFAPFINSNNISEINDEIETAIYHVERNGNGKIIFSDLSIKLTRLIHKK